MITLEAGSIQSLRLEKPILEEFFLAVPQELAVLVGIEAAIVLQQIHRLTHEKYGKLVDGVRWIWNSRQDWISKFLTCFSEWRLRKAVNTLKAHGLIKVCKLEKSNWNHTNHYAVDYERLKALQIPIGEPSPTDWRMLTNPLENAHQSYRTENSSEITSETTTSAAAFLKIDQESSPDLLTSLEISEEATSKELKISVEDQCSAVLFKDEKIEAIEGAGIAMNPHLLKMLVKFGLDQVKAALSHYKAVLAKGAEIRNSAGWLTDCLKHRYWEQENKASAPAHACSNIITAADQEKVEIAPMPKNFKEMVAANRRKLEQEAQQKKLERLGFSQ